MTEKDREGEAALQLAMLLSYAHGLMQGGAEPDGLTARLKAASRNVVAALVEAASAADAQPGTDDAPITLAEILVAQLEAVDGKTLAGVVWQEVQGFVPDDAKRRAALLTSLFVFSAEMGKYAIGHLAPPDIDELMKMAAELSRPLSDEALERWKAQRKRPARDPNLPK